jgi:hypothetical protein
MVHFDKIFKTLTLVAVGMVVVACGESSPPPADPEADHCERAVKRLTREQGPIAIIEAKAWTIEDVRNVRVRFAYLENGKASATRGIVMCSYAFPVTVRGDKYRHPQALSVNFHARNLSTNELLLLNMGLRGVKR